VSAAGGDDLAVGKGLDRVDGPLKVTGRTPYASETPVANSVHAVLATSAIAVGRIAAIDTAAARAAPGVLAVVTHENAPRLPGAREHGQGDRVLQLLQDDAILYADQPIAIVVAGTREQARHAATLLAVKYEARAPNVDLARETSAAMKPEETARGPTDTSTGDFDAALARARTRIDRTYTTPIETPNPMEPHGTVAIWPAEERLTVYDSTQGVAVRGRLARLFGLSPDNVRVISLHVGGGFGGKGTPWSHVPLAAIAARVVGRPVRLSLTRHQMFSLVGHRPVTEQRLVLGADARGKLLAIRHEVRAATSRFDELVEPATGRTRMLYACDAVRTSHRLVRLEILTPTFTGAPGDSSGTFALESAMDELAYALKMDPLALRLASYADEDPESGKPFSSRALRACCQQGAERFGWARRKPAVRSMRDGRYLVGWGMATATYPAGQSPAAAAVRLRADGAAIVQTGSQDLGTGTYAILGQIAADALGLPMQRVRVELGDARLPEAPLSAGSRTASSVASAVKGAAARARAQLVALAIADPRSPLRGLSPDAVTVAKGQLQAAGDRRDSYAAVLARAGKTEVVARPDAQESPAPDERSLPSFGAQFAEVRVDPDTCEVRVTRFVGAFAAGKVLNAKTGRSQLVGGIVRGIGTALLDRTERDLRTGRVVTRDLADCLVPVSLDVPPVEIITVDEEAPCVTEVGAKGIGELGTTGVAAAIANAVFHATGRRVRELPITPDKLL
jgi:xanthine dehydrogenase YagR molybdenum-binding subunit